MQCPYPPVALHNTNIMFLQDLVLCLQLAVDCLTPKKPADCFIQPSCGCANPGKEMACESCEYLEACLSDFPPLTSVNSSVV